MLISYQGQFLTPGMISATDSIEQDLSALIWGPQSAAIFVPWAIISGAARDAGNTGNTAHLRPGLVMGRVTASGEWIQYDQTATDGSNVAQGILATPVMTTVNGTSTDKYMAFILISGYVQRNGVCLASSATQGLGTTGEALNSRIDLGRDGRIVFDDDLHGVYSQLGQVITKTAAYTIVALADQDKTFSTTGASGAVTFSLPAATVGQRYKFRVGAAQELRIDPNGTETIALPSTGVAGAAGKYLTADAVGETVAIECVLAGNWNVFGYTGTWTAEA